MSNWKYPDKGELPTDGRYVLCQHRLETWNDEDDDPTYVVLKFVLAEQGGNNKRPYQWEEFGPGCFFGQDILRWQEIDR